MFTPKINSKSTIYFMILKKAYLCLSVAHER